MRNAKSRFARRHFFLAAAAVAVTALPLAQARAAAQEITLALPRSPQAGDRVVIEVLVGGVTVGQQITLTTGSGQPLGTISPFGARVGQAGGKYSLPVPAELIHDARLTVLVAISRDGGPSRAPTAAEVTSVKLMVVGGTR